ncbi:MAG: Gfo/Idh/MocA family oxidoreductase [Lachnospiraceae bacterium]|nr:Gfo/Idh/MocA family oxidoreductase [Lachnospiraceae bacterium]
MIDRRDSVKNILIIGLGSMGKRRIRCLLNMGFGKDNIIGFDMREDRLNEAKELYGIHIESDEQTINYDDIKAVIVSLPPDKHFVGAKMAIDHNLPVFIEASVVLNDVIDIKEYNNNKVFIAPSYTMSFHPMIKVIREIVITKKYGGVTNFTYHCGQYLPDWHPWEDVKSFYVGKRETGGAREIVPFELTWITHLLGFPKEIKGYFRRTMDVGADIEDTYSCNMIFDNCVGSMIVDVTSRYAIRHLILNMEHGQIQWSWDEKEVRIYDARNKNWIHIKQPETSNQTGYNVNINENMYVEELSTFLAGIEDNSEYYNSIDKDIKVLEILKSIEDTDGGFDR